MCYMNGEYCMKHSIELILWKHVIVSIQFVQMPDGEHMENCSNGFLGYLQGKTLPWGMGRMVKVCEEVIECVLFTARCTSIIIELFSL